MLDTSHFEGLLKTRQKYLEESLHHLEEELDAPKSKDWEDRASEREDDEVMELQGCSGLKELEAITNALHRIEAGSYGDCFECGDPISKARLEAVPTATHCRFCAREQ